jgi:4-amino-4-deoxy-L-arabinose transferase-like glycosyltransferase
MDKILAIILFILAIVIVITANPDGALAVLLGAFCAIIVVFIINSKFVDKEKLFLRRIFLVSLILRAVLATVTYLFEIQEFFGGDSLTYDRAGYALYSKWFGYAVDNNDLYAYNATVLTGSGFGMSYIVAAIYSIVGRNLLATQLFNSVLGATTACLIYVCAKNLFSNFRVAKLSAIFVGVFPSLILWSSQGLKDGIICFLLALAINNVLALQKKIDYFNVLSLLISLVGIYTLRFYIFFAFAVAIMGAFFLSTKKSGSSIIKQVVVLIIITLGLTYIGVLRNAQENLEVYGNLEKLQTSRRGSALAESGFGQDIDVSTSSGALQVLPIGLMYLMLAPFPWQVSNIRQAITLPEVFVWWGLMPFLGVGIWFTLKNRLRESLSILLLTLMLTLAYAIFQGNVGTAYRMRAQMQIFYFIFIAVGLTIWQEKRENRSLVLKSQNQRLR